jgi:hypothetical protein
VFSMEVMRCFFLIFLTDLNHVFSFRRLRVALGCPIGGNASRQAKQAREQPLSSSQRQEEEKTSIIARKNRE